MSLMALRLASVSMALVVLCVRGAGVAADPNAWQSVSTQLVGPMFQGGGGYTQINALTYGSVSFIGSEHKLFPEDVVVGLPGTTSLANPPFPGPVSAWRFLMDRGAWMPYDMYPPFSHAAVVVPNFTLPGETRPLGLRILVYGGARYNSEAGEFAVLGGLWAVDPLGCTSQRIRLSPAPGQPQPVPRIMAAVSLISATELLVSCGCVAVCLAQYPLPCHRAIADAWVLDLQQWQWRLLAAPSPNTTLFNNTLLPAPRFGAVGSRSAANPNFFYLAQGGIPAAQNSDNPFCYGGFSWDTVTWGLDLRTGVWRRLTALVGNVGFTPSDMPALSWDGNALFVSTNGYSASFIDGQPTNFSFSDPEPTIQPGMAHWLGIPASPDYTKVPTGIAAGALLVRARGRLLLFGLSVPYTSPTALPPPIVGQNVLIPAKIWAYIPASLPSSSACFFTTSCMAFAGQWFEYPQQYVVSTNTNSVGAMLDVANVFLAVGGNIPTQPLTLLYDVAALTWSVYAVVQQPVFVTEPAATKLDGNCMLLSGGMDAYQLLRYDNHVLVNETWIFCANRSIHWRQVRVSTSGGEQPPPIANAAAAAVEGAVYIYGGFDFDLSFSDTFWALDMAGDWTGDRGRWLRVNTDTHPQAPGPRPPALTGAGAVGMVLDGLPVFVLQGGLKVSYENTNDVWVFVPAWWRSGQHWPWVKVVAAPAQSVLLQRLVLPYGLPPPTAVQSSGLPTQRFMACLVAAGEDAALLVGGTVNQAVPPFSWVLRLAAAGGGSGGGGHAVGFTGRWVPIVGQSALGQAAGSCGLTSTGDVLAFGGIMPQPLNSMVSPPPSVYGMALTCNAGSVPAKGSSAVLPVDCIFCPRNAFAAAGAAQCTPCSQHLTTSAPGSVAASDCVFCAQDTCHGHGSCTVQVQTGAASVECHCDFGFSGDFCEIPWIIYAAASVGAALLLALVVWVLVRKRILVINRYSALQEQLLSDAQLELSELNRVFEIDPADVHLERRIGMGAFGEVHVGTYCGARVAVKILLESLYAMSPETADDFQREVDSLKKLRHRHIVHFYGAGMMDRGEGDRPFLVTEFMARGALRELLLDPRLPLRWDRQLSFARQTAEGMAFLHSLSPPRMHRDLKSANLLVSDSWTVKVADFGTARLHDLTTVEGGAVVGASSAATRGSGSSSGGGSASASASLRSSAGGVSSGSGAALSSGQSVSSLVAAVGGVGARDGLLKSLPRSQGSFTLDVGTPLYAAPELLRGQTYGLAIDVFSFAIVMWEIACRAEPYLNTNPDARLGELLQFILAGGRPEWNSDVDEDYRALAEACWADDPAVRPGFPRVVAVLAGFEERWGVQRAGGQGREC